jgi:ABC-2 type transport system permease protein
LKKSFIAFWRRNLTFSRLAMVTNLQYRFNFFIDALVQPSIAICIETLLWLSIFSMSQNTQIGGFDKNMYLAYVAWAPFLSRIGISWMYEGMMINDVTSGGINITLSRPISFYEYYLSQLMGYKMVTTLVSVTIPLAVSSIFNLPIHYDRLPISFLLIFCYLILVHNLSFIVCSLGFFMNKVNSLTVAKNLSLMFLAGDFIPLDLLPATYANVILKLPFASSVYIPASYITGRVGLDLIQQGFISVFIGIAVSGSICWALWKKGLREYTGTGA